VLEPEPQIPVGPASRGEVAQRLLAASPQTGRALADNLLPAVRLAVRREPDAALDVAQSKIGGAPDLPVGTFWPSWTPPGGEKRYLQFFAQVDLAEVAAAAPGDPGGLGLPADGLLSFFADFDPEQGDVPGPEAVVVHFSPADAQFTRCGLRLTPVPTAHFHPLGTWTWPGDSGGTTAVTQEEEAALLARVPERYHVTAHHQMGGHVPGVEGATLLLQVDSEASLELAWGAGGSRGRLVWTMPAADLASRNWEAARLTLLA